MAVWNFSWISQTLCRGWSATIGFGLRLVHEAYRIAGFSKQEESVSQLYLLASSDLEDRR